MGNYNPWNKGLTLGIQNQSPMPFEIPKGYKSMHVEVEMSLEALWSGKKKLLRKFHKPKLPRANAKLLLENPTGFLFNPVRTKASAENKSLRRSGGKC